MQRKLKMVLEETTKAQTAIINTTYKKNSYLLVESISKR